MHSIKVREIECNKMDGTISEFSREFETMTLYTRSIDKTSSSATRKLVALK
jgi:hypothetical protein